MRVTGECYSKTSSNRVMEFPKFDLFCSIITGGLVVAIFQYISDKSLYELMVMEGTVEVFRGGETMVLNQIDVVPGDIVRLVVSVATCVYSPQVLASWLKMNSVCNHSQVSPTLIWHFFNPVTFLWMRALSLAKSIQSPKSL